MNLIWKIRKFHLNNYKLLLNFYNFPFTNFPNRIKPGSSSSEFDILYYLIHSYNNLYHLFLFLLILHLPPLLLPLLLPPLLLPPLLLPPLI